MLLLLAVIIPLCAAAAVFGSDDDGEITSDNVLVAIAQSQIGNEGGETYLLWYGFDSHVDWCAIFVSWCADQAGMLETDSLPKYAVCDEGIRWFIKKGKWYNRKIEPTFPTRTRTYSSYFRDDTSRLDSTAFIVPPLSFCFLPESAAITGETNFWNAK